MVWLILCFLKFKHNRDWARFVGWCKTLSRTAGIQSVRVTYFLRNQEYRFPTYEYDNWPSKCSNCSTRWPCNRTTEPYVGKGHARKSNWPRNWPILQVIGDIHAVEDFQVWIWLWGDASALCVQLPGVLLKSTRILKGLPDQILTSFSRKTCDYVTCEYVLEEQDRFYRLHPEFVSLCSEFGVLESQWLHPYNRYSIAHLLVIPDVQLYSGSLLLLRVLERRFVLPTALRIVQFTKSQQSVDIAWYQATERVEQCIIRFKEELRRGEHR